jgi:hypothetical protein
MSNAPLRYWEPDFLSNCVTPVALLKLKRLGLIVGSHLTAAAHELRRGFVLDELGARVIA